MNHPTCVLRTSSKKVFSFPKVCILLLLLRDVICFHKACFIKPFDHHSHNITISIKIFHSRTIEHFRMGETFREHILQILLKTDLIGWGCPRLCPVKSPTLPRTDIPQPPWESYSRAMEQAPKVVFFSPYI